MQNETKKNQPARPAGSTRRPRGGHEKPSGKETSSKTRSQQYTARQRERMQKGLRILAKIIGRAHLRKQAESADSD